MSMRRRVLLNRRFGNPLASQLKRRCKHDRLLLTNGTAKWDGREEYHVFYNVDITEEILSTRDHRLTIFIYRGVDLLHLQQQRHGGRRPPINQTPS